MGSWSDARKGGAFPVRESRERSLQRAFIMNIAAEAGRETDERCGVAQSDYGSDKGGGGVEQSDQGTR